MAAVEGSMKFGDEVQDYVLLEEDTKFDPEENKFEKSEHFAREKRIKLILKSDTKADLPKVLAYFDNVITEALEDKKIDRFVHCTQCKEEGLDGHFFAVKAFQIENEILKCSNKEHFFRGWNLGLDHDSIDTGIGVVFAYFSKICIVEKDYAG